MWAIGLAAGVQSLAILGLVACAILRRRGWRPRGALPALILLLVLSDLVLLAVFLPHWGEITRGGVPERP